jgi:hypothetical protein
MFASASASTCGQDIIRYDWLVRKFTLQERRGRVEVMCRHDGQVSLTQFCVVQMRGCVRVCLERGREQVNTFFIVILLSRTKDR